MHRRGIPTFVLTVVLFGMACWLLTTGQSDDRAASLATAAPGSLPGSASSSAPSADVRTELAPAPAKAGDSGDVACFALDWRCHTRVAALSERSELPPQEIDEAFVGTIGLRCRPVAAGCRQLDVVVQLEAPGSRAIRVSIRLRDDGSWRGVAAADDDASADAVAMLRSIPWLFRGAAAQEDGASAKVWTVCQTFALGVAEASWSMAVTERGEPLAVRRLGQWRPRAVTKLHLSSGGEARLLWAPADSGPASFPHRIEVDETLDVAHEHVGLAATHRVVARLTRCPPQVVPEMEVPAAGEDWPELHPAELERPFRAAMRALPLRTVVDAVRRTALRSDPLDPEMGQLARLLPELFFQVPETVAGAGPVLLDPGLEPCVAELVARALLRVGEPSCQALLLEVLPRASDAVRHAVIACTDELPRPSPVWIGTLRSLAHTSPTGASMEAAWLALGRLARRTGGEQSDVADAAWRALTEAGDDTPERRRVRLHALAVAARPEGVPLVLTELAGSSEPVRAAAAGALGSCGDERHREVLQRVAERDPASSVRAAALDAMAWLDERGRDDGKRGPDR
ncbi:MAG: HEAT repeat domain-containing protein [Planctomycetota bacterium]